MLPPTLCQEESGIRRKKLSYTWKKSIVWFERLDRIYSGLDAANQAINETLTEGVLGMRFHCHVCGKRSTIPGRKYRHYKTYGSGLEFGNMSEVHEHSDDDGEDWGRPGDLTKCKKCHKWTCEECVHDGICKKCGEKL